MRFKINPLVYPALATISWGTNAVAGRILVGEGHIDGITLTFVRFSLALPLLGIVALATRRSGDWESLVRSGPMLTTAVLGLLGIAGFNILFYTALGLMEASLVSLLTSLATPLTYIMAVLISIDVLTASGLAGTLSSFAGTYFVLGPRLNGEYLGGVLAIGAAVAWSLYTIILRTRLPARNQNIVIALTTFWGTLFTAPAVVVSGGPQLGNIGLREVLLILYVAVVPGAIGYTLWNIGVEKVGAARSAIFIPLVPLTAALLGVVLLGEKLTPLQAFGGLLILAGIVLVVRK
ncbi:MAG: DMT family transporter [Aeropyrum sp.]|nr:DMT family transporter [Aeropyrum sp.]